MTEDYEEFMPASTSRVGKGCPVPPPFRRENGHLLECECNSCHAEIRRDEEEYDQCLHEAYCSWF